METVIMKFGGASVASADHFSKVAEIILSRGQQTRVVVVVSAMGDTTDQLLALARQVHPEPPLRELDMLISVGERISIALLAMALHLKNKKAVSLTGSQSGIITSSDHSEARIVDVRPHRILRHLHEGAVVIVAGFQGVSQSCEITTLGRGGSDTTAVALGIALNACGVEFYKDVPGIYTADPKTHPGARLLPHLSYTEALDIAVRGAEILHQRAIVLAEKNQLSLHIRSFLDTPSREKAGTVIGLQSGLRVDPPRYE